MKKLLLLILCFSLFALFTTACSGNGAFAASSWPGLTTDGDTVFLAFGPHIYGLDASNGAELWRFPEEAENNLAFFAAPVLGEDGQLIAGGYDNVLYTLDPATGEPGPWTFATARNRYIGSPQTVDGVILAPSADSRLYALDASGRLLWEFATEEAQWAQPVTDGERVYLASLDHHVYALDLRNGQLIWKADLGGAVVGSPWVGTGAVYAGSFARTLTALDAQTGQTRWVFPTQDWVWAGPVADGKTLYFGDIGGAFYAVDAASGESVWTFSAEGGIFSAPLIVGDRLYFTTETGRVYALRLDGELLWSQTIGGKIYTSPAHARNLILVALMENEKLLVALDENGIERWSFTPEGN